MFTLLYHHVLTNPKLSILVPLSLHGCELWANLDVCKFPSGPSTLKKIFMKSCAAILILRCCGDGMYAGSMLGDPFCFPVSDGASP